VRALAGYEKALGPDHTSTLLTVHSLGYLYGDQGKLAEAEQMFVRALAGYEKALGPDHTSTLLTVYNLGNLYCHQDKLAEAEQIHHPRPLPSEASTVPNFDFFFSFLRDCISARILSRDSCVCLKHTPLISPSTITTRVVPPHSPIQTSSLTRYEQAVSVTRPCPSMRNAPRSRNIWQSRKHGWLIRAPQAERGI
jgi:Tetratricopeptide repeat